MKDPENLQIFREAYQFGLEIYKIRYPASELYGLRQQIRRAATSIAINISEGCGRQTDKEFLRFLFITYGSIKEVGTLLDFSKDLGYLPGSEYSVMKQNLAILSRETNSLISTIGKRIKKEEE